MSRLTIYGYSPTCIYRLFPLLILQGRTERRRRRGGPVLENTFTIVPDMLRVLYK
jgi:hypothetical protein